MGVLSWFRDRLTRRDGEEQEDDEELLEEDEEELEEMAEDWNWSRKKKLSVIGLAIGAAAIATIGTLDPLGVIYKTPKSETQETRVLSPKERVAHLDTLAIQIGHKSAEDAIYELLRAGNSARANIFYLPSTAIDSLAARLSRAQEELTERQRRLAHTDSLLAYTDSLLLANGFQQYDEVFEALKAKSRATPSRKELERAYAQGAKTGLESMFSFISQNAKEFDYTQMVEPGIIKFRAIRRRQSLTATDNEAAIQEERELHHLKGNLEGFGVRERDIADYIAGRIEILVTTTPVSGTPSQVSIRDTKGRSITTYSPR